MREVCYRHGVEETWIDRWMDECGRSVTDMDGRRCGWTDGGMNKGGLLQIWMEGDVDGQMEG